jgi:hypothetical protein
MSPFVIPEENLRLLVILRAPFIASLFHAMSGIDEAPVHSGNRLPE